jgi:hypothetical protein
MKQVAIWSLRIASVIYFASALFNKPEWFHYTVIGLGFGIWADITKEMK